MKQLPLPNINQANLLTECASNVANLTHRAKYFAHQHHFTQAAADFSAASISASWCNLQRVPIGRSDTVIFGTMTKRELMGLYSDNMVGSKGISRQRYDEILVTADGKCPFCGGIGHATTLDHYLPKANFPQYSICPGNLVPCCRDCNTSKRASFPKIAAKQAIHPYHDDAHFFNDRWVIGKVLNTNPISVVFAASPPAGWTKQDKRRAEAHFKSYDLGKRYNTEVGAEISGLIDLRRTTLVNITPAQFQNYLMGVSNSNSLPLNGWKRTMYAALAVTGWFHTATF
jgi:hypothetical protein